jgi:hypothetical protein
MSRLADSRIEDNRKHMKAGIAVATPQRRHTGGEEYDQQPPQTPLLSTVPASGPFLTFRTFAIGFNIPSRSYHNRAIGLLGARSCDCAFATARNSHITPIPALRVFGFCYNTDLQQSGLTFVGIDVANALLVLAIVIVASPAISMDRSCRRSLPGQRRAASPPYLAPCDPARRLSFFPSGVRRRCLSPSRQFGC